MAGCSATRPSAASSFRRQRNGPGKPAALSRSTRDIVFPGGHAHWTRAWKFGELAPDIFIRSRRDPPAVRLSLSLLEDGGVTTASAESRPNAPIRIFPSPPGAPESQEQSRRDDQRKNGNSACPMKIQTMSGASKIITSTGSRRKNGLVCFSASARFQPHCGQYVCPWRSPWACCIADILGMAWRHYILFVGGGGQFFNFPKIPLINRAGFRT